MNYGTAGSVAEKSTAFGKSLSNGSSDIANYNVFAITLTASSKKATFTFIRGQNARYFFELPETGGACYWYFFDLSLSSNTFSVTGRRNNKLDSSGNTTVTTTISQIRGLG